MVVLACEAAACDSRRDRVESYVPGPASARAALVGALDARRAGKAPDRIGPGAAEVSLIDTQIPPGPGLASYEVLGNVQGEGCRLLTVRLRFDGPATRPQVARYSVFGKDPILVFRQEDLEMLGHWDHAMPEDGTPQTPK